MSKLLFFLILHLTGVVCFAQITNIKIDETQPGFAPSEPAIMLNPLNLNQVVAGANLMRVYYSQDGGLHWTGTSLNSAYGIWGDPCLTVDAEGNFYYFHLSNSQGKGWQGEGWLDRMVCQKSTDGGAHWQSESYTGFDPVKRQDKPWSCVDWTNSPYHNTIYLTWTQFDHYAGTAPSDSSVILFSRSADGGQTWSTPLRINTLGGDCLDDDATVEGAVPCVGPNGEIYVAWANIQGIVFDRSTDGGATWLDNDILAATQPGGWNYAVSGLDRANGLPIVTCDLSNGPHRGTIYLNWSDQRNGKTDTDIWLASSTDKGNTWSAPRRVNTDPPGRHNFLSWMAIDQTNGSIYIVFYDRRDIPGDQTDVYLASSSDGGQTFANQKISASPFTPVPELFLGDYTNITAHNGRVLPIWTRSSSTGTSIWTAALDMSSGVAESIQKRPTFTLHQNYPNPFSHSTAISFTLPQPHAVSFAIYDAIGVRVAQLYDGMYMSAGIHTLTFDNADYLLPAGLYFYEVSVEGDSQIKRMLMMY